MVKLRDAGATTNFEDMEDVVDAARRWYDYSVEKRAAVAAYKAAFDAVVIADVDDLNTAIGEGEEAMGHRSSYGHGDYSVSAASEAGFSLSAETTGGEDEDE